MNGFEQVLSSHMDCLASAQRFMPMTRFCCTAEDPRPTYHGFFSRGHPNKARPTKNPQFLKARSAMLPHWMLKRMNVVSFVTSERNLLSRPHPKLASSEQALTRHKLHKYCFAIWLLLLSFVYTGFSFLSSKLLEDAEDTATAKHHKLPGCQDN